MTGFFLLVVLLLVEVEMPAVTAAATEETSSPANRRLDTTLAVHHPSFASVKSDPQASATELAKARGATNTPITADDAARWTAEDEAAYQFLKQVAMRENAISLHAALFHSRFSASCGGHAGNSRCRRS